MLKIKIMKRFFILFALMTATLSAFAQSYSEEELKAMIPKIPGDSLVRRGTLDNGLTYYIRHNAIPAQRAEFYLATNVGAIQETPDQDGLAHFLEHMCFNGTKNFPGKAILDYLQSIGASFGGNVNASTGVEQTVYMLNNIPLVRPGVADTCLLILHDYSHFVTCDPAEIDKERPVILEEKRSRRTADWRIFEQSLPYLYGDCKYATCTIIGSEENLKTFAPESLTTFYHTWYRPDMQAVIVVGDVDPDAVEASLKRIFADIPAVENPVPKATIALPKEEKPRVGVITDPEASEAGLTLLWENPARSEWMNETAAGFMTDLATNVIGRIMSERFADITAKADSPFLSGDLMIGNLCESSDVVMATVSLKVSDIAAGVKAFYTEVEKARRYGFTEAEITRAREEILAGYERAVNSASTRKNSEFVWPLIRHFFDSYAYPSPQDAFEMAKGFFSQLDKPTLDRILPAAMGGTTRVILYSGPEKEGIATPSKEDLEKWIAEVEASEIAAPTGEEVAKEFLDPATLKGSRVKKTLAGKYGSTEWILANGVKVVVLPTQYKKDQILFNLFLEGGESLIETEELPSFERTVQAVFRQNAGVAGFKGTDVPKMLSGKKLNGNPFIEGLFHGISGNSTRKDLETAFQLLYLEFTQPRFDQDEFDNTISQLRAYLPNLENRPEFKLQQHLPKVIATDPERSLTLDASVLDRASLETIERVYRRLFASAAGATMVIVGDVELETLQPLVEKYIGSLPKGRKPLHWIDRHNDIPAGAVEDIFPVKMETPKTTVLRIYTDNRPFDVAEDVAMDAVEYILDMVYVDTLREDEGGTYGASVISRSRKSPRGRYMLQVVFETQPEKADNLRKVAGEELRKLAEEGPTADYFARTVEHFNKSLAERKIENGFWYGRLLNWYQEEINLLEDYEKAIQELTPEKVKAAAKALLDSGNLIDVVMQPQP